MPVWIILVVAVVAYLVGSIPMGYVVVRLAKGVDIREVGSGRTGGTNAMRAGGLLVGFLTTASDMLKGFLAVVIARAIAGSTAHLAEVVAGLMAIAGHNWSIYMGFKGGAGTSPSIGASIAFWPWSGLYLAPMIPFGLFVVGYASVTSIAITVMVLATFVVRAALQVDSHGWYVLYGLGSMALVVWALRPNIERLRQGSERMIGPRARRQAERSASDDSQPGAPV